MSTTLGIQPDARLELVAAIDWYEREAPGHGKLLKQAFYECVEVILENPTRYARDRDSIRFSKLQGYPYNVIFVLVEQHVEIISFFHTSRSPRVWRVRARRMRRGRKPT